MYCKNCGKEINEGIKYCPFCGTPVVSSGKPLTNQAIRTTDALKNKISPIKQRGIVIGIVFILCVCVIGIYYSKDKKSDLDMLVGTWMRDDDNNSGFVFYEPYSKDGISGDCDYIKRGEKYYGEYEWHEPSKRIGMRIVDNWGAVESVEFNYEFVNNNTIILTEVGGEDPGTRLVRK